MIKNLLHIALPYFSTCIVDDFYTFNNNIKESKIKEEKIQEKEKNEYETNIINSINDIINEEEISNNNPEKQKNKSGLILNPKNSKHLPTDSINEIEEKTDKKEYNKNDKLIYKKFKFVYYILFKINIFFKTIYIILQ